MIGKRRKAREIALQILYLLDAQPQSLERAIEGYFTHLSVGAKENLQNGDIRPFAEELVRGVYKEISSIDQKIMQVALNWRLERMARVDRNVLRLAVYEILLIKTIPTRVSLNEAIELAKRFGTAESPSFINGILDKVAQSEKNSRHEV